MCLSVNLFENQQFKVLVVFPTIFVADTTTKMVCVREECKIFLLNENVKLYEYVSKHATLLKLPLLLGYFSRFLNCPNGTKSRKTSQIL